MKQVTAVASPNVALVKYWGKSNDALKLPANGSIGITLAGLKVVTSVTVGMEAGFDRFILNGKEIPLRENFKNLHRFLQLAREWGGVNHRLLIRSRTNFPTSAGLASSGAGYAALSAALNACFDLDLDLRRLSMLARRGSGSAARSIFGGFVEWHPSLHSETESFASPLAPQSHWPELRVIICETTARPKRVSSTEAMRITRETSPYYPSWVASTTQDLEEVRQAIQQKDLARVGRIAEHSSLKMHALLMSCKPAIIYWNHLTFQLIREIHELRAEGVQAYLSIDAGPQVKVLCHESEVEPCMRRLAKVDGEIKIRTSAVGSGVQLLPSSGEGRGDV